MSFSFLTLHKKLVRGRMSHAQLLHARSMGAFSSLRYFVCLSRLSVSWCRETSSSTSTVVLDATLPGHLPPRASVVRRGSSHTRWPDTISSVSIPFTRPTSVASAEKPRPHYFKFQLFPGKALKIKFDRLALLALMDRWGGTKNFSQSLCNPDFILCAVFFVFFFNDILLIFGSEFLPSRS